MGQARRGGGYWDSKGEFPGLIGPADQFQSGPGRRKWI